MSAGASSGAQTARSPSASAPASGVFISFEGIDGAGKSTHIAALQERLAASGRVVVTTREPGGTALAEALRALVLHERMDALCEALLVFAARRDHLQQVILPALRRGDAVLCDRFTDSSFAYQGGGQGLPLPVLETLERWVQGPEGGPQASLVQPDLTLWFDLPPALAAARRAAVRAPDRFESQDEAFFARVRSAYLARASGAPLRFVRLDAQRPVPEVWASVEAAVRARGWIR